MLLKQDAYFFISAYDVALLKSIVRGIRNDSSMFNGIEVLSVGFKEPPQFKNSTSFVMGSPVLLKDYENKKHLIYLDDHYEKELTNNFKRKLESVGINSEGVEIIIDPSSTFRQTKMVEYKGIYNKTTFAPVVITGNQEQLEFAWCAGLGNSTGIGFGALK